VNGTTYKAPHYGIFSPLLISSLLGPNNFVINKEETLRHYTASSNDL